MSNIAKYQQDSKNFLELLTPNLKTLASSLGSKDNAVKFISGVNILLQNNPKLLKCKQESLFSAVLECASAGLVPSSWRGDCYIVPYKDMAQFQLGYKGCITLIHRSKVDNIDAQVVYKNDYFDYAKGLEPYLKHKPTKIGEDKGEPVAVYAVAKVGNEKPFEVLDKEEVMRIKAKSPSGNSEYSPWNNKGDKVLDYNKKEKISSTDNDPLLWMWRKCAVKQLSKLLPLSDEAKRAVYIDNVCEGGGYLEKDRKIIEANEAEEEKVEPTEKVDLSEKFEEKKDNLKIKKDLEFYLLETKNCTSEDELIAIAMDSKNDLTDDEFKKVNIVINEKRKLF